MIFKKFQWNRIFIKQLREAYDFDEFLIDLGNMRIQAKETKAVRVKFMYEFLAHK